MLTTIGRLAVGRACVNGSLSGIRRVGQFTSHLERVCVTRNPAPASRVYSPGVLIASSRSYATATEKATAPKAKKSSAKKSTKPKPATKAKTPAKKVKKPAKPVTAEDKQKQADLKAKQEIKELKAIALLSEPKALPSTAWSVLFSEKMAQRQGVKNSDPVTNVASLASEAAASYKNLSVAEREQLNHRANQNKEANAVAYKKWVESHTPEEIRLANKARRALRRIVSKAKFPLISDSRQVKRPLHPYTAFVQERFKSGDFQGIRVKEAGGQLAAEWKALSTSEKQPYLDAATAQTAKYASDYKSTYKHDPPSKKVAKVAS